VIEGTRTADGRDLAEADAEAGISLDAPLPALVSAAVRLLGAFWSQAAQGTGLSPAGLAVLRLLAAHDGLKSSEVAARGRWAPGTVTSVVDTLVRDGHVERRRDERDRRVVRLYLTSQGRRKTQESISLVGPKWQEAFGYVAEADEPVIRRFLLNTIERFGTLVREERTK
jgi:DNA-binding MarR family transcriptional regulator